MTYVLHYAPDNASLVVRLALEARGLPYRTALVDRATAQQRSAAYRAMNPAGLIPVLETPQGPVFETAAILLYLADRHGGLAPLPDAEGRGDFLKWLFYLSNTVHPAERMMFYPAQYIEAAHADALRAGIARQLSQCFDLLEEAVAAGAPFWSDGGRGAAAPGVLDFYLAALLRWPALYPGDGDRGWFHLGRWPALSGLCARLETLPATVALQSAEGLGDTPFTAPTHPSPPEGSAT